MNEPDSGGRQPQKVGGSSSRQKRQRTPGTPAAPVAISMATLTTTSAPPAVGLCPYTRMRKIIVTLHTKAMPILIVQQRLGVADEASDRRGYSQALYATRSVTG